MFECDNDRLVNEKFVESVSGVFYNYGEFYFIVSLTKEAFQSKKSNNRLTVETDRCKLISKIDELNNLTN